MYVSSSSLFRRWSWSRDRYFVVMWWGVLGLYVESAYSCFQITASFFSKPKGLGVLFARMKIVRFQQWFIVFKCAKKINDVVNGTSLSVFRPREAASRGWLMDTCRCRHHCRRGGGTPHWVRPPHPPWSPHHQADPPPPKPHPRPLTVLDPRHLTWPLPPFRWVSLSLLGLQFLWRDWSQHIDEPIGSMPTRFWN